MFRYCVSGAESTDFAVKSSSVHRLHLAGKGSRLIQELLVEFILLASNTNLVIVFNYTRFRLSRYFQICGGNPIEYSSYAS